MGDWASPSVPSAGSTHCVASLPPSWSLLGTAGSTRASRGANTTPHIGRVSTPPPGTVPCPAVVAAPLKRALASASRPCVVPTFYAVG